MKTNIVVFEQQREQGWKLDFRLDRGDVPAGVHVLATVDADEFEVEGGDGFYRAEIIDFCERRSGYRFCRDDCETTCVIGLPCSRSMA